MDYFNSTLVNQQIDVSSITEYNIYIPVFTLFLNNNYSTAMKVQIFRDNTNIEFTQVIPSQSAISYRFLANIEYEIYVSDLNDTVQYNSTFTLDENNYIINFGYYSAESEILVVSSGVTIADFIATSLILVAMSMFFIDIGKKDSVLGKSVFNTKNVTKTDKKRRSNSPLSTMNKRRR
jgi:hypothetical protein